MHFNTLIEHILFLFNLSQSCLQATTLRKQQQKKTFFCYWFQFHFSSLFLLAGKKDQIYIYFVSYSVHEYQFVFLQFSFLYIFIPNLSCVFFFIYKYIITHKTYCIFTRRLVLKRDEIQYTYFAQHKSHNSFLKCVQGVLQLSLTTFLY